MMLFGLIHMARLHLIGQTAVALLLAITVAAAPVFALETKSDDERSSETVDEKTADDEDTTETLTPGWRSLEERMWRDIYAQAVYSTHVDHNLIGDASARQGIHWVKLRDKWIDLYVKERLLADVNRDPWNNVGEGSFGVQYKPFDKLGLNLFAEIVGGRYTGGHGDDDESYHDYRTGMAFWQWWGRQPYEIERTEYYLPFNGWREFYADSIFFHRLDNNWISNAHYREGLALGKLGPVSWDAYLAMKGGIDASGDSWNNYATFGPGIRIAPFKDVDLKFGVEFLRGQLYRGDVGDSSRSFNDVQVFAAFYIEF